MMQRIFRRRRLTFCQRKAWGDTLAYMRRFDLDSTIVLAYWGKLAYQVSRPACWTRNRYRWHRRWYRVITRSEENMNISDYQRACERTMDEHTQPAERLVNSALGLAGEAGEIAEIIGNSIDADPFIINALQLAVWSGRVCDLVKKERFHGAERCGAELVRLLMDIHKLAIDPSWDRIAHTFVRFGATFEPLDVPRLREEGGDAAWYLLGQFCAGAGIEAEDMLAGNLHKLASRYPDGFSFEASTAREGCGR